MAEAQPVATTGRPPAREYVRIEHVSKKFGDFVAVDNVTLTIGEGEIFCLREEIFFVPVGYLVRAHNARTHRQDHVPGFFVVLRELEILRSRPHDAHVPNQHVEKLGQLVQFGSSQKAA